MGWMERCQCGKVWVHTGSHSYRRRNRRYDLVLSQQANPAVQGGKQTSSLHTFLSIAVIVQTPSNLPIQLTHILPTHPFTSTWTKSSHPEDPCQTSELTMLIIHSKSPKDHHHNEFNFYFCSIKQIFSVTFCFWFLTSINFSISLYYNCKHMWGHPHNSTSPSSLSNAPTDWLQPLRRAKPSLVGLAWLVINRIDWGVGCWLWLSEVQRPMREEVTWLLGCFTQQGERAVAG